VGRLGREKDRSMRAFGTGSCGRRSGEKDGRENVAVVDLGILSALLPIFLRARRPRPEQTRCEEASRPIPE